MKLLFKQRIFSWLDSYDIYDEKGETVYTVKGQLSFGHKLFIYNKYGEHIGTIKEEILTFLPRFALYENDGIILAYHMNSRFEQYDYVVIPKFYTKDGKYVFIGKDAFISYKDIIYKQIIKQENKPEDKGLVLKKD